MVVTDEFVDYVVQQLSRWGEVSVRRMFGGAGLYRARAMFAVVADDVAGPWLRKFLVRSLSRRALFALGMPAGRDTGESPDGFSWEARHIEDFAKDAQASRPSRRDDPLSLRWYPSKR